MIAGRIRGLEGRPQLFHDTGGAIVGLDAHCPSGTLCLPDRGDDPSCERYGSEGEACSGIQGLCGRGLRCIDGMCVARVASGAACTASTECLEGLVCPPSRGTCGAPSGDGDPCDFGEPRSCVWGTRCVGDLTTAVCRARASGAVGTPCNVDDTCAVGTYCSADGAGALGLCTAVAAMGRPCTRHTACADGEHCGPESQCRADQPDGEPCGSAAECLSGWCVAGACTSLCTGA